MAAVQMEGVAHLHQMEDHLHVAPVADHQTVEAALQEQEAADHLQEVQVAVLQMEEATVIVVKAHHQKDGAIHQAADADVKEAVLHQTGKRNQKH